LRLSTVGLCRFLMLLAGLIGGGLWGGPASAYPDRPVRVVVPYAPAGPVDLVARLIADKLSTKLNQTFFVDDKPGANGVIGMQAIMNSPPDGLTLLLHASAGLTIYQAVTKEPAFDTLRDLTPISMVAYFDLVLCASPSAPFSDVQSFLAYARANPGKISYGSAGIGAMNHIGTEWLKTLAGIDIVHVPYRGDAPVAADLINGTLGIAFISSNVAIPYIQSGKLKALAVPSKKRMSVLPDTPTMAEAGFPTFDLRPWMAFFGPAGLPKDIAAVLDSALKEILAMPDVNERLNALGMTADGSTAEELNEVVRENIARWKVVVAKARITVE
jgi:tripartite-type tricarboxylate transporter receptor subunit TctC